MANTKKENLDKAIAADLLKLMFEHPNADFTELLAFTGYQKMTKAEIEEQLKAAAVTFKPRRKRTNEDDKRNSIIGHVRVIAIGNLPFTELTIK